MVHVACTLQHTCQLSWKSKLAGSVIMSCPACRACRCTCACISVHPGKGHIAVLSASLGVHPAWPVCADWYASTKLGSTPCTPDAGREGHCRYRKPCRLVTQPPAQPLPAACGGQCRGLHTMLCTQVNPDPSTTCRLWWPPWRPMPRMRPPNVSSLRWPLWGWTLCQKCDSLHWQHWPPSCACSRSTARSWRLLPLQWGLLQETLRR